MNRAKLANAVLALLLVALLPLEPARCVCPPAGARMAQASATAQQCHRSCCSASHRGAPAAPTRAPQGCPCAHVSATDPPAAVAVSVAAPQVPAFAVLAVLDPLAARRAPSAAAVPALDIGSPPLPVDPGAHGLRAPPFSV